MRDPLSEIAAGRTVRYDNAPVSISGHAVEQSNERHFRRLDADKAEHELYALLDQAVVTREPPPWIFKRADRERVKAWLVVESLRLCFPLYAGTGPKRGSLVAGTLLTARRDEVGAEVRIRPAGSQRVRK
jgi:hypothetical protein